MLAVGARAPEFTLPDHTGRERSLTDFLNQGSLILYFYPADFTPICTREACAIRDIHEDIVKAGLTVVGISPQRPARHEAFRQRRQLPFTLLSDQDKQVIRMYDVDGLLGFGVRRVTYLIDSNRYIHDAVSARFRIGLHEAFIRRAIAVARGS